MRTSSTSPVRSGLGARPIIHRELPDGFTEVEVQLHVVVDGTGHVESAAAWNLEGTPYLWAKEEAEVLEKSQKFQPFKRWGKAFRPNLTMRLGLFLLKNGRANACRFRK